MCPLRLDVDASSFGGISCKHRLVLLKITFHRANFSMNRVGDRWLYFLVRIHIDDSYKCKDGFCEIRSPMTSTVTNLSGWRKYMSRRAIFVGFTKRVVLLSLRVQKYNDKIHKSKDGFYTNEFSRLERTKTI